MLFRFLLLLRFRSLHCTEKLSDGGCAFYKDYELLFTGWADIKNDMLSLQSISGKHNQTPKEFLMEKRPHSGILKSGS